jgi:hypothetical protein
MRRSFIFKTNQYAVMKKLFLLICIISFFLKSSGQLTGKPVNFVAIETTDSTITKETLYLNGVEWIGKHFNNANKVIQISDKEAGLILAKGSFNYDAPGNMLSGTETRNVSFMLKLSFKNGKYKIEMSDFKDAVLGTITEDDFDTDTTIKKTVQKQWKAAQKETQGNIAAVHKSIKEFMEQNINW